MIETGLRGNIKSKPKMQIQQPAANAHIEFNQYPWCLIEMNNETIKEINNPAKVAIAFQTNKFGKLL